MTALVVLRNKAIKPLLAAAQPLHPIRAPHTGFAPKRLTAVVATQSLARGTNSANYGTLLNSWITIGGYSSLSFITFTFAEQLDSVSGDAGVELLADQPMRHRIIMPVDVDMVVQPNPPDPPLGVFKGLVRQWLQRRAVELKEEISAADP
jgi:hypothetical protein